MKFATLAFMSLLCLAVLASAGPATDTDGDGVFDVVDNCRLLANGAPLDCDSDADGYGNLCDGDFDQNLATNAVDFGKFVPVFKAGSGAAIFDMDCNGAVSAVDFGKFVPNFKLGKPGPSGLWCAGMPTVPCDL